VIDDEPLNLTIARKILADQNYEIDECMDVNTGLDMLVKKAHDIALIDIHMPEVDGVIGAWLIKKLSKSTKIFALTSDSSPSCIRTISRKPFDSYLIKPYSKTDLLELIG
jgi:CheY-like chemotaxis protein